MKIGITGIGSTLGAVILEDLLQLPQVEEIIGLDIRYRDFLDHPMIRFVEGDVRDRNVLIETFQDVDVLLHMAFIVIEDVPQRDEIYDINVNGSRTVFSAAAELGIKKIIYTSSVAAYGVSTNLPIPITEETPVRGHDNAEFYYGYTKGIVAGYLDEFEKSHPDIIITRFRPHVIMGPKFNSMTGNSRTTLKYFLNPDRPYLSFQSKKHHSSNGRLIQYTDERDLSKAISFAVESNLPGVYNIAGEPFSLDQFLRDREQKHIHIPIRLALFLLSLGGLFSRRLRGMKSWLKFSVYPMIMSCNKLLSSEYPYPLTPTKKLVLESIDFLNSHCEPSGK